MKWLGRLGRWTAGAVVMSFLSIFTTYVIVTTMVDEVLKQFQLPPIGNKLSFSQITGKLGEQFGIGAVGKGGSVNDRVERIAASSSKPSPSPSPTPSAAPGGAEKPVTGSLDGSGMPSPSSSPVQGGVSSPEPSGMPDAVAVMGELKEGQASRDPKDAQKRDVVMSTDDFSKKKDALSSGDKQKIFSILVAKLPAEEVQKLSAMVEDGITAEELKEVDSKLKKYLNSTEYEQLSGILKKYGG
ncbi:hypothetical protein YDYSY3_55110 [Paenibacillus chitinolyticus]|uniref:hypothetical protein n=1 Tax=Paenibacillus chitinolyticus TaxID=79263 RepID=UPI0026E4BF91|nr:hypothetical protein [Paenibacillus chitinolyticus]GKS14511.1 hypothetical protein YDYSY3_55110 [Paenibacillus chitinolyticus]